MERAEKMNNREPFKRTFPGLIVQPFGRPVVVREQLDDAITNALEAFEARKAGKEAARA